MSIALILILVYPILAYYWRGVREAEGARLEIVCTLTRTEGSNPSLSARWRLAGPHAAIHCETRQVRKEAAAAMKSGALARLAGSLFCMSVF